MILWCVCDSDATGCNGSLARWLLVLLTLGVARTYPPTSVLLPQAPLCDGDGDRGGAWRTGGRR